jgi:hypothetical protein
MFYWDYYNLSFFISSRELQFLVLNEDLRFLILSISFTQAISLLSTNAFFWLTV